MQVTLLTGSSFDTTVNSAPLAVVRFAAKWCGPCRNFKPIYNKVAAGAQGITFGEVDIDDSSDLASRFKVRSVPTTLVFRYGQLAGTLSGGMTEAGLTEWLSKFLP